MAMNITQLIKPAADLCEQTWAQRLDYAGTILFVHGYISQSQREKITRKIEKQFIDAIAAGEIVARAQSLTPTSSEQDT